MRNLLVALSTAIASVIFLAPAAFGANNVRCVGFNGADPAGCTASYSVPSLLQSALTDAAAANGDTETIVLASDDFVAAVGTTFTYTGGDALTVQGQGIANSRITGATDEVTFASTAASGSVTFKNLRLILPEAGAVTENGIDLGAAGGSFDGAKVETAFSDPIGGGAGALIHTLGPMSISNSQILGGPSNVKLRCIQIDTGLTSIDKTSFKNCYLAINLTGSSDLNVSRSIFTDFAASAPTDSPRAFILQSNGETTIDNNIIDESTPLAEFVAIDAQGVAGTTLIRHNTLLGGTAQITSGLVVSDPHSVKLFDNVIDGSVGSITLNSSPTFVADHNYYDVSSTSSAPAALPGSTNVLDDDVFLDPLLDINYTPEAGSPLRDNDTVTRVDGQPPTDYFGLSRTSNGARDLGAVEVQVPPVIPPPVVTPAAVIPSFSGSFKFSKAKVKRKKAAKVSFTLTAPATVGFKLKASKKKNKVPKLKSAAGTAGANTYSVSTKKLKAGKYTLTATLPSGVTKSAKLTITK